MFGRIALVFVAAGGLSLGLLAGQGGSATQFACGSTSSATSVGSLTVVHTSAQINGVMASTNSTLHAKDTVCTDSEGQIQYTLTKQKKTICDSGTPAHASKIQLYPNGGSSSPILQWLAGWTWCTTAKTGMVKYKSSHATLAANDPLFGVFVTPKSTTAKVALGFLDVSGRSKKGVIVGPAQQVTVPAGGDPGAVAPIELTDGDRATIADLAALVPPPSFARPDAGSSEVLARIYARRSIRVGFDAGGSKNPRASAFVKKYFTELARLWKLKLDFSDVPGASAPSALANGEIDVAVTPATPDATLDVFPFFAEPKARLWRIELVQDDDWNAGMRAYVTATLNTARYAKLYRANFRTTPPYEPLRPLLFP